MTELDCLLISGQNLSFTYKSTQTSTILSNSILTLDNQFTFSYAPSNAATSLLTFQDFTSILALNHTTFYLAPGLQMSKGGLNIRQAPTIYANGEGLTFGDE